MIEREQLEMDVVFVGAGPANLAAALHLKNAIKEHDELVAFRQKTRQGNRRTRNRHYRKRRERRRAYFVGRGDGSDCPARIDA